MDNSHFHFYDWETSFQLVKNAGYEIIATIADGHFPLPILRKITPSLALNLDKIATRMCPGLFALQFVIVAKNRL